jgi:hypothetical protein
VRVLLILAAHHKWAVHHIDVKSTFLNGDLTEEIYVGQPPGFTIEGQEHKVLRLHKALYDLQQAPRAWNSKLDAVLHELDFKRCKTEHGIYTRVQSSCRLVVGVYVDDLIITEESFSELNKFKEEMKRIFHMSDLGALSYYLGIEVNQNSHDIELGQSAYAMKLLERAGLQNCNSCATPMKAKLKSSRDSKTPSVYATGYRGLICCLRYLLHTRSDLTFSVSYLSQFMEAPKTEHPLRYVSGTLDYGLLYPSGDGGEINILGFSDSDMAGDIDDSKSTTGVVFLGGNPVTWSSQKQSVVALSSCEAEYIAGTTTAFQAVWLA